MSRYIDADILVKRIQCKVDQSTLDEIEKEPTAPVILREDYFHEIFHLNEIIEDLREQNKIQGDSLKLALSLQSQRNCFRCKKCSIEIRCMHDDIEMNKSDLVSTGCQFYENEES